MIKNKYSLISNNYPSILDNPVRSEQNWLIAKNKDDNAEGLWRIHDTLYDLTNFLDKHPGGKDWLVLTQGTDITEAFETHHINMNKVLPFLKKYEIREALKPRNYKFTFNENGFYRTLKGRVSEKLLTINTKAIERKSKIIMDSLVCLTYIMAILSVKFNMITLAIGSGIALAFTMVAAHNYCHRADNYRMYYFNLGFLNYRQFRISHALSHHLFPNSIHDLEILMLEPLLCWLPTKDVKGIIKRYASLFYGPLVYASFFVTQFMIRTATAVRQLKFNLYFSDLLPYTIPLLMYIVGNSNLMVVLKMWIFILLMGSFYFALIGINAGHHHHEIVHDGDKLRDDLDWGVYTMDTVIDRADLRGNHFLVLTHFGDHALHHLFPTIDHGILPEFYPILFETIDEFEADLRCCHWFPLIVGQQKQLLRIETLQDCPLTRSRIRKLGELKK